MACKPCEAKRRLLEEQARRNIPYVQRPTIVQSQPQNKEKKEFEPASPKFQSPSVLPPLK